MENDDDEADEKTLFGWWLESFRWLNPMQSDFNDTLACSGIISCCVSCSHDVPRMLVAANSANSLPIKE